MEADIRTRVVVNGILLFFLEKEETVNSLRKSSSLILTSREEKLPCRKAKAVVGSRVNLLPEDHNKVSFRSPKYVFVIIFKKQSFQ